MSQKIYLLDAYALIYRGYYALIRTPRINSKKQDTTAIFGFLNTFEEIVRRAGDNKVAVVFDPPGGSFRDKMFEDYKAQREKTPEPISFGIPYIKKIIEAYGIKIYEVPGYEADDVIGTIAHKIANEDSKANVYMITPDKDYGQLVTDQIHILRPEKGAIFNELGPKEVAEKHELTSAEQVIDFLALVGDTADNVPGVANIGPKTASKLLNKYKNIEGIYENIDQIKGKQKENLIAGKEQLKLSRELVVIEKNVPMDFDVNEMEKKPMDYQKLVDLYEELEFRSKLSKLVPTETNEAPKGPMSLFDQTFETTDEETTALESSYDSLDNIPKKYHLLTTSDEIEALAKELEKVSYFAFDTETDSLDAMSCGIVGISFSTDKNLAWYIPLSELPMEATQQLAPFRKLFADGSILKIGQNVKFDLKVISRFGIKAVGPFWDTMIAHYLINPELRHGMDTMAESYLNYKTVPITELIGSKGKKQLSMRQVPPEEVSPYACEDADITLQLYHKLRPILEEDGLDNLFYNLEMPLMEVLLEMEQVGVKLNAKTLNDATEELNAELISLEKKIHEVVGGIPFNINSPKEVGDILFEHLQLSEKPKKTKTGQFSTNEEELQKIADRHPVVNMILRYRGIRKLVNTYIEPLPTLINPQTGRIHTTYNQTITATGRLSSTDPNLQNIPVRDEDGKQIRKAFTALVPGDIYLSADYSQIELRLMAHFSKDPHMIEAFNSGKDIHTSTAAKIYHISEDEVTSELRRRAKTANFGIIYGISAFGLANRLTIPRGEANDLIKGYFEGFPGVKEYMENIKEEAKKMGYVDTIMGRRRYLKDINSQNSVVRGYAERNAINAPLQGSAADIIKMAMVNIQRRLKKEGLKTKMILQVHDELNFSVPTEELEIVKVLVRDEMENVCPDLLVPLTVDIGIGDNWLEAH